MHSEDENTERIEEPQPSTSRLARGRLRRSIMTPSPIRGTDSEESESEPEKLASKIKRTVAPSVSKKRSHSGVDENEKARKRKKSSVERSHQNGDSDSETSSGGGKTPSKISRRKTGRSKNKSNDAGTSRTQPSRRNVSRQIAESQKSRTQPSTRIPSPPISGVGSQSIFSDNILTSHPGVIKRLTLHNFMCHSDFTYEFHPNLNFITGQNGSGKSALLSGILIALGGKAAVTSRTTTLKDLVQKGKSTARVSVTLLNKNGLRTYGDEITIERSVNVSGSTAYRIKSSGSIDRECSFNWRPLKKPELDRILLGLNIQIDNPVAVLNQEVARTFLRSKDPKVKFNLFYDGTLLSKLENVIEEAKVIIDETNAILSSQNETLGYLKGEIVTLRKKCNKITELDQIKTQCSEVRGEYLWSIVIEQEISVDKIKKAIANVTKEIELLKPKLEELKVAYSNTNEDSLLREQTEVQEQLDDKQREADRNRAELNEVKKKVVLLRAKLKTIGGTVHAKELQYKKLSTSLEKVKAQQESRAREETNEDEETLRKLETAKKETESVLMSLKSDADNFRQAGDLEREKLQEIDANIRRFRAQIEVKKQQISSMSNRNISKYAPYGAKMQQLVNKIQANIHKFRKPPKGPLGACFRVKDPMYVAIIEGILWNHLNSFVVGDPRDLNLLREMIDSIYSDRGASQGRSSVAGGGGRPPTIHSMSYSDRVYDIARNHASHPDAPSIFDLIEVENDDHIVMNALIDIEDIERQIIFRTTDSAAKVLKNESTVPRSLKFGYTLNWYKFTPAPRYAARVMKMKNRADFLKSGRSKEAEVQALRSEIKELEQEMRSFEPTKSAVQCEEQSLRQRYDEKTKEINDKRWRLGEISNEIKRHVAKIKEKEKRCDFTSWYEELQELRDELEKQTAERDATTKELEPLVPKMTEFENRKQELQNDINGLTTKMGGFQDGREKINTRKLQIDIAMKKVQTAISNLESRKSNSRRDLATKESELKEKLDHARKEWPSRVHTKRSSEDVKKDFEGIKIRIAETEARLGDVNELRATLKERLEKFESLKSEYTPLKKMHKMVHQTNIDQHRSFEKMKAHMGRTLMYFFSSMSKQRGYEGRLHVEFETKELYYFVCPDGDSASKTLKAIDVQSKHTGPRNAEQIKQSKALKKALVEYSLGLSGGERSFATICFIMALWQVMECPFYMLDEFDVFMDAFNRKTSQLALMIHAKRFSQNQFVLFTPLDLENLPDAEDGKVLRLYPPVRNGGGGGAGGNGSHPSGSGVVSPQGGNVSNQGTSSTRDRGQADGSPSDSIENVDPCASTSQGKGKSRGRGKQKRQATNVMGLIQ